MNVIVCEEPNRFVMHVRDIPQEQPGEALLRIRRIGICGSDLHSFRGNQPFFEYPRILGHELAAEVVRIGDNEQGLRAGDYVTIIPYMECGSCLACRNGKTNCCTHLSVLGVHQDGGMCEYITVTVRHLIKTEGITLDQAAIVECLSIGAHSIRRARIGRDEFVLVIGVGPIGLGVMKYAKLAGARVIAMDVNEERLAFCKQWAPADYTVNAMSNPLEELMRITDGDLPTAVMDATGNLKSMESAVQYVAHGGRLVYVGLVKADITFNDPEFHKREMSILSSRNATPEDFQQVMTSIRNGHVDTDAFITHRSDFVNMIHTFDTWLDPRTGVIKAMVELN